MNIVAPKRGGGWGRGWFSLEWPILAGSSRKGYLSQASGILIDRDFAGVYERVGKWKIDTD